MFVHSVQIIGFSIRNLIAVGVEQIGDPEDAVRKGARALIEKTEGVYPVNKIFSYVMEGLNSKSAWQCNGK
jgi:hypothetical protein